MVKWVPGWNTEEAVKGEEYKWRCSRHPCLPRAQFIRLTGWEFIFYPRMNYLMVIGGLHLCIFNFRYSDRCIS